MPMAFSKFVAKYPGPEYGLYSTAHDLSLFYQMMLNGGTYNGKRILSKASVEVATALHTAQIEPAGHSPGMGYGLAWTVVRDPFGMLQLQSIGTFGHGGAFGTQGWMDPKREIYYVLMVQRQGFGDGDALEMRKAVQDIGAGALAVTSASR